MQGEEERQRWGAAEGGSGHQQEPVCPGRRHRRPCQRAGAGATTAAHSALSVHPRKPDLRKRHGCERPLSAFQPAIGTAK